MSPDDYRIIQREYGDGRVVYVVQHKEYPDYPCAGAYWNDFKICQTEQIARVERNNVLKDMIVKETVMK
jgi:hypothetical protein